jgi:hypothetical protein
MFFRGRFLFRFLAALLLIGILVGGAVMLYQAGMAQGYAMGVAASGKAVQPPSAGMPYYYPGFYPGFWRPGFFWPGPFFGLFFFGGLIFLFFFIGGLFRARAWGRSPMAGGWHGDQPRPDGPPTDRGEPKGTGSQENQP